MQGCLMGDTLWIVPPGRPIRDLLLLYVTAFLRALSTGLIGVLLGIYLAKFGFNAAQIGYVIRAGLAGGACATLLVTLAGNRFGRNRALVVSRFSEQWAASRRPWHPPSPQSLPRHSSECSTGWAGIGGPRSCWSRQSSPQRQRTEAGQRLSPGTTFSKTPEMTVNDGKI